MVPALAANAACTVVKAIVPEPAIQVGATNPIVISGLRFQPAGTSLATNYVSAAQMAAQKGLSPDDVLFRCAAADASQIYEGTYMFRAYSSNLTPAQTINGIPYWPSWVVYTNNVYTPVDSNNNKIPLLNLASNGGVISNNNNWKALQVPSSGGATSTININFSARIVPYGSEMITPDTVRTQATFMLNKN